MSEQSSGGAIHFASRSGRIVFGGWVGCISAIAAWFAVDGVRSGSWGSAFGAVWCAMIALGGAWGMSTSLDLSPAGGMTFRGPIRTRTRQLWDLRQIGRGNVCLVLRFADGTGTMLVWLGPVAPLVDELERRNPYVQVRLARLRP